MHVRTNWKTKILAGALSLGAFVAFVVPAHAQISVTIGRTPPPLRYERRTQSPGPGYVWIDGYWGVQGNRYVWVPGRWDRAPYEGAYWSHPHYDRYNDGWHLHEGHWDREDHGNHYGEDRNDQRDNQQNQRYQQQQQQQQQQRNQQDQRYQQGDRH